MITPVENGRTCPACGRERLLGRGAGLARRGKALLAGARVRARRCSPRCARIGAPGRRRCSRQTVTGAAQKRFCVKTPATRLPSASATTRRSLRSWSCGSPAFGDAEAHARDGQQVRLGFRRGAERGSRPWTGSTCPSPSKATACRSGQTLGRPASGELAVAVLVLLAGAAGARIVAADLLRRRARRAGPPARRRRPPRPAAPRRRRASASS